MSLTCGLPTFTDKEEQENRVTMKTGIFMPNRIPKRNFLIHSSRDHIRTKPTSSIHDPEERNRHSRNEIELVRGKTVHHQRESPCDCCEQPQQQQQQQQVIHSREGHDQRQSIYQTRIKTVYKYSKNHPNGDPVKNGYSTRKIIEGERRLEVHRPIALMPEQCSCTDCRKEDTNHYEKNNDSFAGRSTHHANENIYFKTCSDSEDKRLAYDKHYSDGMNDDRQEYRRKSVSDVTRPKIIVKANVASEYPTLAVSDRIRMRFNDEREFRMRRGNGVVSNDALTNGSGFGSRDVAINGKGPDLQIERKAWGEHYGFSVNGRYFIRDVPKVNPHPRKSIEERVERRDPRYHEAREQAFAVVKTSEGDHRPPQQEMKYQENCDCEECSMPKVMKIKQEEDTFEAVQGSQDEYMEYENSDKIRSDSNEMKDSRKQIIIDEKERLLEHWKKQTPIHDFRYKARLQNGTKPQIHYQEHQNMKVVEYRKKKMNGSHVNGENRYVKMNHDKMNYDKMDCENIKSEKLKYEKMISDRRQQSVKDVVMVENEDEQKMEIYEVNRNDGKMIIDDNLKIERNTDEHEIVNVTEMEDETAKLNMSDDLGSSNQTSIDFTASGVSIENSRQFRNTRDKDKRAIVKQIRERDAGKKSRALANWLERKRVAELNDAFERLRKMVPAYGNEDRSLSKIKTLRYASTYINHLATIHEKQCRYGIQDLKKGMVKFLDMDPLLQRCQEHLETQSII